MTHPARMTAGAIRTPLGHDVDRVIDRLLAGERAARPNARFDARTYACTLAATIDDAPSPHRILRRMGRFGADAAREALARSGVTPGPRLALFCGVGGLRAHWDEFLGALAFQAPDLQDGWRRGLSRLHPYWMLKHLSNNTQAELARELGALGDGATFGGGNAGAAAIAAATACLADGAADAALVVAYDSLVEPETVVALAASGAATTDGLESLQAPYCAAARGAVPGEAAAAIVLEPGQAGVLIEAATGVGEAPLATVAHLAAGAEIVDGAAAARPAEDAAERALFAGEEAPLLAIQAALGQLGAATAAVQAVILGRLLSRGVWPPIAGLAGPTPGPLTPLTDPLTHAARSAVGLSAAPPGLAAAVRVSRTHKEV